MNQKIEELARTLVQSGMAASESEGRRMAEEMVSTESKVQEDFDTKKDKETMYGKSPRSPPREGQGILNQTDPNSRNLNTNMKTNPVDGTPITPVEEQKPRDNVGMVKVENPHMTPEEYSASQLNVAKSTSELIQEENMSQEANQETEPANETIQQNSEMDSSAQSQEPAQTAEELTIPKPDDPVEENPQVEEQKPSGLPELNPLDEEPAQSAQQAEPEVSQEPAQETQQAEPTSEAVQQEPERKMTPEEYTAGNNQQVSSDGKPLPQTNTPNRPQMSQEEKDKMEESKVDLTKIFKV